MQQAIRQHAVVRPGGVVEVQSSDLEPGVEVEVIVLIETAPGTRRSLSELFGAASGSFATPDEADAFLRSERDAWQR